MIKLAYSSKLFFFFLLFNIFASRNRTLFKVYKCQKRASQHALFKLLKWLKRKVMFQINLDLVQSLLFIFLKEKLNAQVARESEEKDVSSVNE